MSLSSDAGRALRGRRRVDELHTPRAQHARQLVGAHALLVDADPDQVRLRGAEREPGAEVAGLLDHDGVSRVEQHAGGEVDGLLRAVHHHHVVRGAGDAAPDEVVRDGAPQWLPAEGILVIGEGGEVTGERLGERPPQLASGQTLEIDLPAAEVEADGCERVWRPEAGWKRERAGA